MPVIWTPSGQLDVSTDPSDLPEQTDGKSVVSGAMVRCTNLDLDRNGIARTRRGSYRFATALAGSVSCLIEQNGKRYAFAGGHIYEDEVSLTSGLGSGAWTAVKYAPYNDETWNIYATDGTYLKRIEDGAVNEWGITAPTTAPTVSRIAWIYTHSFEYDNSHVSVYSRQIGALSNAPGSYQYLYAYEDATIKAETEFFTETYDYYNQWDWELNESGTESFLPQASGYEICYTWVRKVGDTVVAESNPSPVTQVNKDAGWYVTWPAPTDSQVTHVRFYRSLKDTAGVWYYDGEAEFDATAYLMQSRDFALGAQCATDHDRPPTGITKLIGPAFGGQLFGLVGNRLYYCTPKQPEYWPADFYIEIGPPQLALISGEIFGGQMYVANSHDIFSVSGTGANTYIALNLGATTGTVAKNVFTPLKGTGLVHLGNDGLYAYSAGKDDNFTNSTFRPIFEGTTVGSIDGIDRDLLANCWCLEWQNKLYFGYPSIDATYADNIFVFNPATQKTSHYQYSSQIRSVCIDYANQRLLAGDTSGYIWEIEKVGETEDNRAAISWQVQTKSFVQFEVYFPRWTRYDVNLNNGATATGSVLLSDAVKQTHTISTSRDRKKRLVAISAGSRLSVRLSGTGPVDIYGLEVM